MQFLVFNRDRIESFTLDRPYVVISITEPNSKFPTLCFDENRLNTLRLKFHDLNNEAREHIEKDYPTSPKAKSLVFFNEEQARQIVEFVKQYKDQVEVIVCQCDAGISRSAGTAAALSKYITGSDDFYFKHYLPNSLVYSTILNEFYKENKCN